METCTVAGRQLTVVDTPGWWMNYFTQDSTAFDKQEIVNSVYSCSPGPHAFALVVRVDRSFTEIYRRAIEEHLELVSKEIWRHTILLFTFGDWLGDTTIEQHIESEGKMLQWLVERCGDWYHVLNNRSPGNGFQIAELLEKIEDMIAGTGMSHFEIDMRIVEEIERKKQEEASRVKLRCENVLRKRQMLKAFKGKVILLGAKHTGKTSAARCILGNCEELTDNQKPLSGSATINEKKVDIMDTPGWTTEYPDSEFNKELLNVKEIGFSEHSLPDTSGDLTIPNTDSSHLQIQNQALACTGIRLCNRNLSRRNIRQKLIVVLNASECLYQNEPFIGVNRTERPEIRHELQTLSTESQEGRRSERPRLLYQRCTPYTGQTAKKTAFLDFVLSGSLQDLIDQWGDSNIEELEAFIDSYFEMVWQETKAGESSNRSPINCEISGITESGLEYMASIDRKLSKLDILEDVQKDLKELKQNLEHFSRILQELKGRSKEPCLSSQPCEATGLSENGERD
ncbi:putative GTPase IMAP family member 8 [Triplophysa rosa]|uniref:GTPase IMAP family member 8 n=1 Tax=Triplophysa rosa TaxID=992332 RepID=A0A9W7WAZ1_TRIRA|nr:putative GTPase IMAP family member 8 [Triplophysa rosa]